MEEGVAVLRKLIATPAGGVERGYGGSSDYSPGSPAIQLARIGMLLKRKDWIEEGLRAARPAKATRARAYYGQSGSQELVDLLLDLGRGPEAEAVAIEAWAAASQGGETMGMNFGGVEELIALASVYHRTGRHADVLTLLEKAPGWLAIDLAEVYLMADSRGTPIGHMAAAALVAQGQKERALPIVQAVLEAKPGFDPAYELLAEIQGEAALPFLESLQAQNRFEERPLIWKAFALFKAGKAEAAEQAAREAIKMDLPTASRSTGGGCECMLSSRTPWKPAASAGADDAGAVAAIRLAERADEHSAVGLTTRAIRMYQQSLKLFTDAYCIQSRLAIQLAEQGRYTEAESHHRRAFELMPVSFGRVESHCFGCEHAFEGKLARATAESVFTRLAKETPDKPQVHYLLGYLRDEQAVPPKRCGTTAPPSSSTRTTSTPGCD